MSEEFFLDRKEVNVVRKEPEFKPRPKTKISTRGGEFDRDICRELSGGSQFVMILIAAHMAREVLVARRKTEIDPYVTAIDGLLKLQEGGFDPENYVKTPSVEWVRDYYKSRINEGWC